jgi:hypothetical protein
MCRMTLQEGRLLVTSSCSAGVSRQGWRQENDACDVLLQYPWLQPLLMVGYYIRLDTGIIHRHHTPASNNGHCAKSKTESKVGNLERYSRAGQQRDTQRSTLYQSSIMRSAISRLQINPARKLSYWRTYLRFPNRFG